MDKPPKQTKHELFLNYKIWLSGLTGNGKISDTTFELLGLIKKLGSIKLAAQACEISYRKAWGDIESAEKMLSYQLIEKQRGGKEGGHSQLTPACIKLLEAYEALQQKFDDSVEKAFNDFEIAMAKKPEE
ncbi:MAG: LysR family transcriptional regulator [Bacteroidetes bacterium]|jgi:molybdate transport system regulatory protein|nr:LysR family transcriptional regulator [Bacteroidota bacterium]MBU1580255.1 LysR family transcriptional regulator [Bacteroidota bacterium]MBU2466647.1 LysR family transcriptional regulator [Bacteroidota bacterium]MBU2557695.1 LysR family transcriptional regulator [Bacteroidota bacterium]MDA3944435.1 LysR family transcriptional regulator [Bacteroidota bacterium]